MEISIVNVKRLIEIVRLKLGRKRVSKSLRADYQLWSRLYHIKDENFATSGTNQDFPITFLIPSDSADLSDLNITIESIIRQNIESWEIILVTDLPAPQTSQSALSTIESRYSSDSRIRFLNLKSNLSRSQRFNLALKKASGKWFAIIEAGHHLDKNTITALAMYAQPHGEPGIIYSDEDIIQGKNHIHSPKFKPDWNQLLFYSTDYLGYACFYNLRLAKDIGGFRDTDAGLEEFDFRLRLSETLKSAQILHVPYPLYHATRHRIFDPKNASLVLNAHFYRNNIPAKSKPDSDRLRISFNLPQDHPLVSLLIPTRNGYNLLKQCVDSILSKTTYTNYEIIVIDNGSNEKNALEYFKQLSSLPNVQIIRDDSPFNYSALNNRAVALCNGDVVALVNNDIEVIEPNWLTEMVTLALQPTIGAVGAKLLYPDKKIQHAGIILGIGGVAGHPHKGCHSSESGYMNRAQCVSEFSAVTAACLVVRKSIYEEVGGLDENHLQVAFNDVDFCLKVRSAGYKNLWTPDALLYHHESATRGSDLASEKVRRFTNEHAHMKQKWGELLNNDPNYNPNLTLNFEDYSLAWPPRTRKH